MVLIQLLLPVSIAGVEETGVHKAFAETRQELAGRFQGLTAYVRSPAKGMWTAPDGHVEHDDVVMVEVVTDRFDRRWWHQYALTLAARFRQQTIHVRALPVSVLEDPKS